MPDYSYVKGDEFHSERRYAMQDENRTAAWVVNIAVALALACLALYGFMGGRGWLAAGVFFTGGWISVAVHDQVRRLMYVLGSLEYRLRLIEADTDATIQDIEYKNRSDRERMKRHDREW